MFSREGMTGDRSLPLCAVVGSCEGLGQGAVPMLTKIWAGRGGVWLHTRINIPCLHGAERT